MKCKICNSETKKSFTSEVLYKYEVSYYKCNNCGFIQTEKPHWLEEAYNSSINLSDTGIIKRNLWFSKISVCIFPFLLKKNNKIIDYAGGYGLYTRLMRDLGYDCYWNDPYTENLFAKGFEVSQNNKAAALTAFEVFEHFNDPIAELEELLKLSRTLFFSTELIPADTPNPDWWYYGFEHGQHISFYSIKTLQYIAKKYGMNLYSNNKNIHLLTDKKLYFFKFLVKLSPIIYYLFLPFLHSKTHEDSNQLKQA